jgi:MYXO-CTERM domain-containing protein
MRKVFTQPKTLLIGFALLLSLNVFSQLDPNSGTSGGSSSSSSGDPDAPIDGGISLLIAAGAAAGARKIYKNKKENNKTDI